MAELHIHGGIAIVDRLLGVLSQLEGLRPAEPGEFTRLAVLNGRMDLTQAEAVADMIDSETMAQQKQAFRQMQGALGTLYEGWRQKLASSLAHLEADIEFADEDLPGGIGQAVLADVATLNDEIASHIRDDRGRSLRHGVEIAIIGAPNVGKSSLLNYLVGREAAIVSARAGTTRDIVEVSLTLGGVPAVLADTAGIREAGDEIEREGVRRALKELRRRIFVFMLQPLAISLALMGLILIKQVLRLEIYMLPISGILVKPRAPQIFMKMIFSASLQKRVPACRPLYKLLMQEFSKTLDWQSDQR